MTEPDFSKMNTQEIFKGEYEVFLYGRKDLARLNRLKTENAQLKTDCRTLAQKLLQVKPELREWLEINFKEYL